MINTKTASRRRLRFASLDEVLADAEAAVRERASTTGNWSLGQILQHLAVASDKSIDGFGFQAPLPIRLFAKLFLKNRFLDRTMSPGFRLPKYARGLIPDEIDAETALQHLRQSIARLKTESRRAPYPLFGPVTTDESNRLQLRHAELHLGFIQRNGSPTD